MAWPRLLAALACRGELARELEDALQGCQQDGPGGSQALPRPHPRGLCLPAQRLPEQWYCQGRAVLQEQSALGDLERGQLVLHASGPLEGHPGAGEDFGSAQQNSARPRFLYVHLLGVPPV